jgi:hypothetical protein
VGVDDVGPLGVLLDVAGEEGAGGQDDEAAVADVGQDVLRQTAGDAAAFEGDGDQGLGDQQAAPRLATDSLYWTTAVWPSTTSS